MQMERGTRNGNHSQYYSDFSVDRNGGSAISSAFLPLSSSAHSSTFIEHQVSRMDTLAGVAIKYGVEVADIKRMNGLVTDLQMFALKSLHIPLPGRHPPSNCLANGCGTPGQSSSDQTTPTRRHSDISECFKSLKLKSNQPRVSRAMCSLQGYYGLDNPTEKEKATSEGFEMTAYTKATASHLEDTPPYLKPLATSNPPLTRHRKSRSLAQGLENGETIDDSQTPATEALDKLMRQRQKSEADFSDFTCRTPEKLLKDDNNCGGFSAIAGKGLALRPKAAANRTAVVGDGESNSLTEPLISDGFVMVRKSSSTSSLQDQENGASMSTRPMSKLQSNGVANSTVRPIFDGLPKPLTNRRNKAALD